MPRLFVAIDLPDTHKTLLTDLRDPSLPCRWTSSTKYHLTLRFIGEIAEHRIPEIEHALSDIRAPSFVLHGHGLGVFPSRRKPRVLFVAIEPAPALMELQTQIEQVLRDRGLDAETKSFRPHVTLARFRQANARTPYAYLQARESFTLTPFTVTCYALYESLLRQEGARHTQRAMFPLS